MALYCPLQEARSLIILTALFLLGRVLFWIGYHYPYVRAFGFGITFYPTVAVYLWLILRMVFGIRSISDGARDGALALPPLLPVQDGVERPHEHQDVQRQIVPDHGADE